MADREWSGAPLVLLAGDPEGATGRLDETLRGAGYTLRRAVSADVARAEAIEAQPDLTCIDVAFLEIGGLELCRWLRAEPRVPPSAPIVLVHPQPAAPDQRRAALRAGAWDCIGWPYDAEELLFKLAHFVRAKQDADRARWEGLVDPITGLYNRIGFARRVREEAAEAFRLHGSLACVVLSLDVPPRQQPEGAVTAAVARCVHALKAQGRLSDAIGQLAPAEFAVLAPATDADGAVKLAGRLAGLLRAEAERAGVSAPVLNVRAGYEAVANVGYAPIDPVQLVTRAAAALRRGRSEGSPGWIRRFDDQANRQSG